MAQKFIILDNKIIIGHVRLHVDLVQGMNAEHKVKGGGYWETDESKHILFLFGKSIDYGPVSLADVVMAAQAGTLEPRTPTEDIKGYKIFYSPSEEFHQALQEYNKEPQNIINQKSND